MNELREVTGGHYELYQGNTMLGAVQRLYPRVWAAIPVEGEEVACTSRQDAINALVNLKLYRSNALTCPDCGSNLTEGMIVEEAANITYTIVQYEEAWDLLDYPNLEGPGHAVTFICKDCRTPLPSAQAVAIGKQIKNELHTVHYTRIEEEVIPF